MKNFLGLAMIAFICLSFTTETSLNKEEIIKESVLGGKVTLINDTSEKVKVHTGSGSVSLNPRGGKTSFSCDTGRKVKVNGKVVFTNNSSYCGETVYISKL